MKVQSFGIQLIIITIAFSLVAAGFATTTAYGLVKIKSPTKDQHVLGHFPHLYPA
jgi:hypothetical protein